VWFGSTLLFCVGFDTVRRGSGGLPIVSAVTLALNSAEHSCRLAKRLFATLSGAFLGVDFVGSAGIAGDFTDLVYSLRLGRFAKAERFHSRRDCGFRKVLCKERKALQDFGWVSHVWS
jgi:hypothetical protein